MRHDENDITEIFGRKGTGKTREMIRRLQVQPRVIFLDFKGGEYDYGYETSDPDEIRKLTYTDGPFCVRIPTRSQYWADWTCYHALKVADNYGPCVLAVDEVHMWSNHTAQIDGLNVVLIDGRMRGLSMITTAHRPIHVHNDLLAAVDTLVIFQTHNAKDVDRFQNYADIDDEVFKTLQQDQYIEWTAVTGKYEIKQQEENKAEQ